MASKPKNSGRDGNQNSSSTLRYRIRLFIERLIGTIRRECLDHTLFWKMTTDLERKLSAFKDYYNRYRVHAALKGQTPSKTAESKGADLNSIAGGNIVAGYIKRQSRPSAVAMDRSQESHPDSCFSVSAKICRSNA